nr:hypothetical protein HK105_003635 [Polyrhizophydium stewartii]
MPARWALERLDVLMGFDVSSPDSEPAAAGMDIDGPPDTVTGGLFRLFASAAPAHIAIEAPEEDLVVADPRVYEVDE